ncbi:MAG: phosphatase PAP2 family protein [Patescibacteria group bacterium]|nr:phosphatase PAP2 family protein [Patescibacteria group bacterium]
MTRGNKLIYVIPVVYIIAVSVYMLWHRAWVSPDQFFAVAIFATLLLGRMKQFIHDWVPVLLLLFGYEYLRGVIPILSVNPHIFPMINADQFLFGFIPTIKLQTVLFAENVNHWYDYLAVILYISHFIIPMVVAFLFWLYDRKTFKKYTTAFLTLSYLAFVTYIIFPAMPPWMASNLGYLPPLQKIMDQVFISFSHPISIPSVYRFFGANLVAAVPSLHAAYPWLIFLFAIKKLGKFALILLPYVLGVWFSVVYLGEHYVIDVVAGILYATLAYFIIYFINKKQLNYNLKGGERVL